MIALATLASSIVTLLSPYLTAGGIKFAEKAGEGVWEQAQKVWALLTSSADDDPKLANAIAAYSDDASDGDVRALLEKKLLGRLERDQKLAAQLTAAMGGAVRIQEIVAERSKMEDIKQENEGPVGKQLLKAKGSRLKGIVQKM